MFPGTLEALARKDTESTRKSPNDQEKPGFGVGRTLWGQKLSYNSDRLDY
jgi:hypothetical protein